MPKLAGATEDVCRERRERIRETRLEREQLGCAQRSRTAVPAASRECAALE